MSWLTLTSETGPGPRGGRQPASTAERHPGQPVAAAFAAAAEFPDGAGEELRAGTYHEQRRARRRRWCEEGPRVVSGTRRRRSHRAVQPRVAVDHLAGDHAAAAYGAPTLAGVIRALVLP